MSATFERRIRTWHERVNTYMLERRLKILDDTARPNGYTFFEVVVTDGCQKRDEEVVRYALEHGWSVWVRIGNAEQRKYLEASEIRSIDFLPSSSAVRITMKPNSEQVKAGKWISSYILDPKDCGLEPSPRF